MIIANYIQIQFIFYITRTMAYNSILLLCRLLVDHKAHRSWLFADEQVGAGKPIVSLYVEKAGHGYAQHDEQK